MNVIWWRQAMRNHWSWRRNEPVAALATLSPDFMIIWLFLSDPAQIQRTWPAFPIVRVSFRSNEPMPPSSLVGTLPIFACLAADQSVELTMVNILSLLLLAGSPVLVAIALSSILLQERPLAAKARQAQKRAVDRLYHRTE